MKNILIVAKQDELVIQENRRIQIIPYNEIFSVVYDSPYITINLLKGRPVQLLMSLSEISQYLPEYFVLCNRSTIINLMQARAFDKTTGIICLRTGTTFTVSFRKRKKVEAIFMSIVTRWRIRLTYKFNTFDTICRFILKLFGSII